MLAASLVERIAYHESGHIAACVTFAVPVISATVVDRPLVHRGALRRANLALEIVGTICFAGPAAEELFCGPPPPGHGGGEEDDYRMAYEHLRRRVGALRRGVEFERLRDSARRLVASPWARSAIPRLAAALQRCGTLNGEQISDVLLG
jgi:hypothetical protein